MHFTGDCLAVAWEQSIDYLIEHGTWVPTERGLRALELRGVTLHADSALAEPRVSKKYPFASSFVEQYGNIYISAPQSDASIHTRMYHYGKSGIDQVKEVVGVLSRSWSSRRAVVSTWQPDVDIRSSHPPCVCTLQFLIRGNALHLIAVLRSNDAWLAAPADMLALSNLQAQVALDLHVPVGGYTQVSVSYHLYEMDYVFARKLVGTQTWQEHR